MKFIGKSFAFLGTFLVLWLIECVTVFFVIRQSALAEIGRINGLPQNVGLALALACGLMTLRAMILYSPYWAPCTVLVFAFFAFGPRWATLFGGALAAVIVSLFSFQVVDRFGEAPKYQAATAEQQGEAVRQFPELDVANSPLNIEFLRQHNAYLSSNL